MESQHALTNPWSLQQQYKHPNLLSYDSDEEDQDVDLKRAFAKEIRSGRNSSDSRHYSYASSITIAPEDNGQDQEEDRKGDINHDTQGSTAPSSYSSDMHQGQTLTQSTPPQLQTKSHEGAWCDDHVGVPSTASDQLKDTRLDRRSNNSSSLEEALAQSADPAETKMVPARGEEHGEISERCLSDSGVGLEGDVLEHLVQQLQSEVADTRAIVFNLEGRLNAAENSNKHIVDELKMLLADAEGTLVGSDESDSGESVAVSSKHGAGSDDDSNVVYNRICSALQSLITEAQSALARTSTTSTALSADSSIRIPCRHHQPRLRSATLGQRHLALPGVADFMDDGESSQLDGYSCSCFSHSSCLTSRRSSFSHPRADRPYMNLASSSSASLPSSSRLQGHAGRRDTFSRMLWKEKQLEQYERYRRSCDRVSLELEMLLNDTIMDSEDLLDDDSFSPTATSATTATTLTLLPSSEIAPLSTRPSQGLSSIEGSTSNTSAGRRKENMSRPGSRAERMQRTYQVQLMSPQVRARQLQLQQQPRQRLDHAVYPQHRPQRYSSTQYSSLSPSSSSNRPQLQPRQFKSKGVGASRPQSIFMQLYALWKQTWLRRRIMHVLTESLELMLILWVVLKLSEASLAWMGIQMLKGGPQAWLTFIYGDREGAGASAAKELYEKIRRDALGLKQMRLWKRQESELLMRDFAASEAALTNMGMIPSTPFTPTAMVWAPAGRLLTHAASGLVLAYLSDHARWLARKF